MNSENLPGEAEKQGSSITKRIIIGGFIAAAAVGLLGAIYWFLRGDPPPIIVKKVP